MNIYSFGNTETWLQFNGTDENSIGALATEAFKNTFEEIGSKSMKLKVIEDQPINSFYLEQVLLFYCTYIKLYM